MAWAAPAASPLSSLPVADQPPMVESSGLADAYFTYVNVEVGEAEQCRVGPASRRLLCRAVRCQVLSPGAVDGTVVCYLPDLRAVVTRQLNSMLIELYTYPRLPPEWSFERRVRELFGRRRLGTIVEIHHSSGRYRDRVRIRFDYDLFPARVLPTEVIARFAAASGEHSSPGDRTQSTITLDPISAIMMRGPVITLLGHQLSRFSYTCPDLQFPRDEVAITARLVGRRVAVHVPGQTMARSWGLLTADGYPGPLSEPHALLLDDRLRAVLEER